jgi:hypothetical protein
MMRVAWVLLAVLVFVSVPRLGAEEVKIIGRDFAFDAPAILGAGMTTLVFENPGDVRHDMIVVLCSSYQLRLMLLRRLLPSPRWSMQSPWPNHSSALPVTLHLPLQTRFLVRPQLLTHHYPLSMGRDIPRSLFVA